MQVINGYLKGKSEITQNLATGSNSCFAWLGPHGSIANMSWLKSLPSNSRLFEVFQAFPETARPLIEYHEALMRGPSPFTVGERELIAAYVSGLNSLRLLPQYSCADRSSIRD